MNLPELPPKEWVVVRPRKTSGVRLRYINSCFFLPIYSTCLCGQVISAFHRRFPTTFTPTLVSALSGLLAPTPKAQLAGLTPELREKDDAARITRQRPVLRVCSELALVGIIRDGPNRSGGEWVMKAVKELVRHSYSHVCYTDLLIHLSVSSFQTTRLCRLCLSFPPS
jgi:hypothetical protein